MKTITHSVTSKKYRGGVFCIVLLISLFLSACKGFFSDHNLDKKIQAAIDEAKAPSCLLLLKAEAGTGDFLSSSEISCKVGYSVTVKFAANTSDYVYLGLQAVSKTNPSQVMEDYADFEEIGTEQEHKNGTYTVKIKLLKKSDDIRISPKSIILPAVAEVSPKYESYGCNQDSTIKITFNKPVDPVSFGDFSCISITAGQRKLFAANRLDSYFDTPYFSDDFTSLYIPPMKGNLILDDAASSTEDITISINTTFIKDADGYPLNDFVPYTYRINKSKDSRPPVFTRLDLTRTSQVLKDIPNLIYSLDSSEDDYNFEHYAKKSYFNDSTDQVRKNIEKHHVNKVAVSFEGSDSGLGIQSLEVREYLLYTPAGVKNDNTMDYKHILFENTSGSNDFQKDYVHEFLTTSDGIIRLQFILTDFANNKTVKEVDVVKDTVISGAANLSNEQCYSDENYMADFQIGITMYLSASTGIYATDLDGITYKDYCANSEENESFEYCLRLTQTEYWQDGSEHITSDVDESDCSPIYISSSGSGSYFQRYTQDVTMNCLKTLYLRYKIMDLAGNICFSEKSLSPTNDILYNTIRVNSSNKTWDFSSVENGTKLFMLYEDTNGKIYNCSPKTGDSGKWKTGQTIDGFNRVENKSNVTYFTINNLPDGKYYVYAEKNTENSLYTPYGKPFIVYVGVTPSDQTNISDYVIPDFTFKLDPPELNTGKRTVRLVFDDNAVFDGNLKYTIKYIQNNLIYYSTSHILELNTDYKTTKLYVTVWNDRGDSKTSDVTEFTLDYDNVRPELVISAIDGGVFPDKLNFKVKTLSDANVGLKTDDKGKVSISYFLSTIPNINENDIDWENDKTIQTVKVNDVGDEFSVPIDGNFMPYIYYRVQDKNGNSSRVVAITIYYNLVDSFPVVTSEAASDATSTPATFSFSYSSNKNEGRLQAYYLDTSGWKKHHQHVAGADDYLAFPFTATKSQNVFSGTYNLNEDENNTFIKICFYYYDKVMGRVDETKFFNTRYLFFYPKYLQAPVTYRPNLKSILKVSDSSYKFSVDQPCFVQTLYGSVNYEDNPEEWASKATEADVKMSEVTFTYNVPVDQIPAGKYYTTVIHYADGSMRMTEVRQK